jgi:4-amino-4-deoxy-L-arabinose transferase-like glycosyltransferase
MHRRVPGKRLIVAAVLIAAVAIRLAQVQTTTYRPVFDAGSYLALASQVAHTGEYSMNRTPGTGAGGTRGPSAYFAPGYPYLLAAVDLIDGHTERRDGAIHPARLSQAVLGAVTVGLIGLLTYELFGPTVALISIVLAAVYPVFIELSAVLVVENLLTPLVLLALWAALRARRATHPYRWVAGAGFVTGLATLTHLNAALILIPLVALVWTRRPRFSLTALAAPVMLIIVCAVTILPWTIRNAIVLRQFIPVSDEAGLTFVGTYNPSSAANQRVPYKWRSYYAIRAERSLVKQSGGMTEMQLGSRLLDQALDYIGDHPLSPLVVAYHNARRMFELEGTFAWKASAYAQGLHTRAAGIGVMSLWLVCLLAIAGAFTRGARRAPPWVWAVPLLLALSVVLVNVETPRFREPVDPFLIMLAACALEAALSRVPAFERRLRGAPVGADARPAVPV